MVTRAAVKITCHNGNEHVIPCHRHCDAFHILAEFQIDRDKSKDIQGFLNSSGVFLDRKEAMTEARRCGQILNETVHSEDLFSEDIW